MKEELCQVCGKPVGARWSKEPVHNGCALQQRTSPFPAKPDPFNEQVQAVVFKFKLRQRVNIKEISRPGIVTGCLADTDGLTYRVAYWNNGERKSEWLFAEELEAL